MSTISVTSTFATHNYLSSVTIAQLDPIDTAVTLRDAVNAAPVPFTVAGDPIAPVITVNAYAELVSSTGNTGTLHVLAQENGTDANLTYTWSIITQPAIHAPATFRPLALFSLNGTNSAKDTSVTFLASGTYTLQVMASDGTQSVTSQVEVTAKVQSSVTHAKTQTTQVSAVQALGDAQTITSFVVTFNGPVDPTTAQDVRGYRILRHVSATSVSLLGGLFGQSGQGAKNDAVKIASAVYNATNNSVTLTLNTPMSVQNGLRLVEVLGTGPHAVLDANNNRIDGDFNGKAGGTFIYRLRMSVGKSITYATTGGDTVKLSLSGPGRIVTLLPTGARTPVIDLIDTDLATSILTGVLHTRRHSVGFAVLDELNGTANATIQLGSEFHVNQTNGAASV